VKRFRRLAALGLTIAVCSVWLVGNNRVEPASDTSLRARRDEALRRAQVWLGERGNRQGAPDGDVVECRFVPGIPTGTTSKFDCALPDGRIVKVKYGRNPELHGEVAATRLLAALGFAADIVSIVPRVRCYGCPRYPFATMRVFNLVGAIERFPLNTDRYVDFEWVSVEHRFDAAAIEAGAVKGWAWWELDNVTEGASRADLDALRLTAVFLAHWDNKAENQRLVCLDQPHGDVTNHCERPLLMIQDLGATFGPTKVNLAQWGSTSVWDDPRSCAVSMRRFPFRGATFPDVRISEEGRTQLARRFSALTEQDIRALFEAARFPEYHAGTNDEQDLAAWTAAFRRRVDQIVKAGPCPSA
jgi:hypothetical protein